MSFFELVKKAKTESPVYVAILNVIQARNELDRLHFSLAKQELKEKAKAEIVRAENELREAVKNNLYLSALLHDRDITLRKNEFLMRKIQSAILNGNIDKLQLD